MGLRASMIVVGDEILTGFTQDTNSYRVAGRLRVHGVPLDRVVTVPDVLADIVEAVRGELARSRPRVLLTSGGIGSTPDDLTLEAVAAALDVDVVVEPEIDRRVTGALEWTASRGIEITDAHEAAMRRMALVPDGAYLLPGARGIAAGIAVDVDGGSDAGGATIVVMPGIPEELDRILADGVEPALLAGRGQPEHVAERQHAYPESTLNPVLERIAAELPDVHLGSYPPTGDREVCTIRLSGAAERVDLAAAWVDEALDALEQDAGAQDLRAAWAERRARR